MSMMRFRLIRGTFIDASGRKYKGPLASSGGAEGPVVASETRLDQSFKNQFVLLSDVLAPGPVLEPEEVSPVRKPGRQAPPPSQPISNAPTVILKAVHKGGGKWIVVEVVDGVQTDKAVHEGYLLRAAANTLVEESKKTREA